MTVMVAYDCELDEIRRYLRLVDKAGNKDIVCSHVATIQVTESSDWAAAIALFRRAPPKEYAI